ncbi:unnamed protein product [Bemisia tabaci]|uniref:3-hydroxyisobutyrate dehydrogenase n=1 Tax=Bemisia tabaci TaxID=7038 RepID=A0A9P0F871_BEMTA|nr:unnamed protein product [Bemisia tabaci]
MSGKFKSLFQKGTLKSLDTNYFASVGGGMRLFSQVGFIGLGNMGGPMANNLVKKNFKVTVFDTDAKKRTALVANGAHESNSLKEVCENAECIVTMLPANQHVLDAYTTSDGILKSVPRGCTLIDCSTIDYQIPKKLAALAKDMEVNFIEAPVSGGIMAAREGRLSFMVGGEGEIVEKARPILEAMGAKFVHCGGHGSGQAAKMCNNLLLAISMAGVSEAMNLGIKLGLDAKKLAAVINTSSGECWSSRVYNPVPGVIDGVPSSKNYEGGFSVTLMVKDLGLAENAASDKGVKLPLGDQVTSLYRHLHENGFSGKDFSVIYKYLESLAGKH